jgi:hypothetical protein
MARREYGTGEKKLSSEQRLKLGKFISAEMNAEKKKEPSKQRKKDQLLAIGYSKLNGGEL